MDIHFHTKSPLTGKIRKEPILSLFDQSFVPPIGSMIRIATVVHIVESVGYLAYSYGLKAVVILGHCPFEKADYFELGE